ncbi:hypothetical protein [Thermoanaerobacter uzonensis]|uniref:hypothetical protein n=1 Tax=Thermoanaerobacter uzonensis TaxID=447593 RepID=UPI003D768C9F
MGRTKQKVRYKLNSGGIKSLSDEEIKVILRATDELIGTGGRSMLAKIRKIYNIGTIFTCLVLKTLKVILSVSVSLFFLFIMKVF